MKFQKNTVNHTKTPMKMSQSLKKVISMITIKSNQMTLMVMIQKMIKSKTITTMMKKTIQIENHRH